MIRTRLEKRAGGLVARITIDNPAKLNILTSDLLLLFSREMHSLENKKELRAVVITGSGEKAFIGGADLETLGSLEPASAREFIGLIHAACAAVRDCPVPVIARINGYCFGAGMELAASCDMRIGVGTAKFGMPEVRFGIPSGMEACLLPQLIGWGKTRELVYTGDHIDAAEACRCGFLEKLVEPAALDASVEQWVSSILAAGPRAIRLQKKLVRDWERMTIQQAVQAGIRACNEARKTDEPHRLMAAFLARKKMRES